MKNFKAMSRLALASSLIMLSIAFTGCSGKASTGPLQKELDEYVIDKDARIGIAVIIDDKDTVGVNIDQKFPMFSVYKFPIALALAERYRNENIGLDHKYNLGLSDLKPDTYSPMIDKYLSTDTLIAGPISISMLDLLAYSLQQSDNNASDIILKEAGGAEAVQEYIDGLGAKNISIVSSEAEMYEDKSLCYSNTSTPLAMCELLNKFDNELNDSISLSIKRLMESCSTGADRLSSAFTSTDVVIGHKTGTGFMSADGRIMALNDCGYVHLPDGHRYVVSVFISDAGYDPESATKIIADISGIVYRHVKNIAGGQPI